MNSALPPAQHNDFNGASVGASRFKKGGLGGSESLFIQITVKLCEHDNFFRGDQILVCPTVFSVSAKMTKKDRILPRDPQRAEMTGLDAVWRLESQATHQAAM